MTQCARLEAELKKGRRLSPMQIINELRIPKYTNRISELRADGLPIKMDDSKGYGVYYLENEASEPQSLPGTEDGPKAPVEPNITLYKCNKGHISRFDGDGGANQPCPECQYRWMGFKV